MLKNRLKNRKCYVVHMLRYGNSESHSYILGVFSKKHSAMSAGSAEQLYRGNKYEPNIVECILDADMCMDSIYPNNWRKK